MICLSQISPAYPPQISGVGDYAAIIEDECRKMGHSVLTMVPPKEGLLSSCGKAGETVLGDAEKMADALAETDLILLHFSGYGYARRGLCGWLADGLEEWKLVQHERRLVTMFHEVYATGPIWRSSFWTSRPQQHIAQRLARLSNALFVSSQRGRNQLQKLCPDVPIDILEVFSNVGELTSPSPLSERAPHAVVFGGASRRTQVYRSLQTIAGRWDEGFRRLGLTKIFDIGPPIDAPSELLGCKVVACGTLQAAEVSAILSNARVGLLDYRRNQIEKSGIAAAYFAHSLLVVNTANEGKYPLGLREGEHIADLQKLHTRTAMVDAIGAAGWRRYQAHGIHKTSEILVAAFRDCSA